MQAAVTLADVQRVLAEFKDPETGRNVVETGQVRDLQLSGDRLSLALALTSHSAALADDTRQELAGLLRTRFGQLADVRVEPALFERPPLKLGQFGLEAKSVIAVGSGKGGVGKSTIAASLALGLAPRARKSACSMPTSMAPAFRTCWASGASPRCPRARSSRWWSTACG